MNYSVAQISAWTEPVIRGDNHVNPGTSANNSSSLLVWAIDIFFE
jgi:hypothetical protein